MKLVLRRTLLASMAKEGFVYVWTLGVEGLGDGLDKLVTTDVKPGSPLDFARDGLLDLSRAKLRRN